MVQKNLTISYILKENNKAIYIHNKTINVIPKFFDIVYKENPAAAFSLAQSIPYNIRRPALIGISFLAIAFFLFWYMRMKTKDGLLLCSFGLILSGAAGNLIDRIRLGYVIDFLDTHLGFLGYPHLHGPIINVADILIFLGAVFVTFRAFWPFDDTDIEEEKF